MRDRVPDISRARVLISNDDGVHAPGLKMLEKVMRKMAKDVWVVAPETEQSAAAHSLTLRRPLRIRKLTARRFAVDGTPTDSVLMGINQVMKDNPPDLVLSGVNRGGNMGDDVTYSGTVAAALEGTLMGLPAIALSQVTEDGHPTKWSTAEHWLVKVLKGLTGMTFPPTVLINVNFPNVPAASVSGIEVTCQGRRKIGGDLSQGVDPRGEDYFWVGPQRVEDKFKKGTDLEAVNRGAVSITPLSVDMTHAGFLKKLKGIF
ncbi:MAG: 5'/3'-nucleotidase SurE [Rhodospirillaceae bacterium]|nr:5'/3'-nucleotidase SurE [Rhodospirillaceae bacterium]